MRNLKKVISSVAALTLIASSASAFAVTFPDVDASAPYANAVDTLVALKIVNGDDNGLFNPDNNVTRAEFTKMAVGALGEIAAAEAQTTSKFDDAANTSVHWAAGFVAQGVADGFINGYDDHRFGPDDQVTYAQAAKMLVAAIGYTSYAEASGGWPSGYVSQASSLGITKGVSATNDTNLTRAQCAIMIYNAMQVPLCVIDSWETQTTFAGTTQVPVLKKLDGKENRDYQTLLTDKHDAYLVKGRVTQNSKSAASGLKKDEVKYRVEVSDNFDETLNITKKDTVSETFKVGATDAADQLFNYTEAIVQKDEDSGEYTIISITTYGNSKSVEFKAEDLADDDSTIKTNYIENGKLPVYKSASSTSTTKYDLDKAAVIYVNGVDAGEATNAKIDSYILQNATGNVTLIDATEVGSTSTDGKYDFIMVDYYVDAVVDYVSTSSSYARIYFKAQQTKATKMEWDPDDEDLDITFTKDGAAISYEDLQEFDVLSIQYDVVGAGTGSGSLTDNEFYNVVVASNVVEGSVTSKDKEEQTVTVSGNEYDLVEGMVDTEAFELGTQYALYIDAFGYVAYYDEGTSDKNYGVIVAMYQGSGDDYPSVRLITSDAKVVAYECKNADEAKKFYNYAVNGDPDGSASYTSFTKTTIATQIKEGKTVCAYKISGDKIRFDKPYSGYGGSALTYKANSSKVGSYSISDASTKIIDMDEYMSASNSGSTVSTLAVADFEDEADYTAYFFDKNTDSVYRFAIVFEGTSSLRPETQLAVVQKSNGQKDVDSTTCSSYTVLRAGAEAEMLWDETGSTLAEGSVIVYKVNSDGYVEGADNLKVLYSPESSYDASFANIIAADDFGSLLGNAKKITSGKHTGKYEIEINSKTSTAKEVFAYLGVVYKKSGNSLELITGSENITYKNDKAEDVTKKGAQVAKNVDISLGGANVYMYDYNQKANKGARLTVGSTSQSTSVFNQAYVNDKNAVVWDNLDGATPQFAFVKEVDGDATDVVLFVAP